MVSTLFCCDGVGSGWTEHDMRHIDVYTTFVIRLWMKFDHKYTNVGRQKDGEWGGGGERKKEGRYT